MLFNHNQQYNKIKMFNIHQIVPWKQPLSNVHKYSHSLFGINSNNQIVEVDVRDSSVDVLTGICPAKEVKFLTTLFEKAYYFSYSNKIQTSNGKIICQSNTKADFVQGLDGFDSTLAFTKYHKNHAKYSINIQVLGNQKKIIRLFDNPIKFLNLTPKSSPKQLLYQDMQHQIGTVLLEHPTKDILLPKVSKVLRDDNNLFMIKGQKQFLYESPNQQRNHYQPQSSKKRENGIRVEVVSPWEIQNYKDSKGCKLEFGVEKMPQKIESFRNNIIVSYKNKIEVFDLRKLINSFIQQEVKGIMDFCYEPNLQKVYLSSNDNLRIYDFK